MVKLVVFVSNWPRAREAKLAYGLQQAGWQVVLLYRHSKPPTFNANAYCVEVRPYPKGGAVALASSYAPVVYHVFSNWKFDVAAALIRRRPGKIVFDNYDMVAGMVKEEIARRQAAGVATERFCLENADGVCCRNLETQYAKRHMGYKYRKRIFFPDYCWNLPNPPVKQPGFNIANPGNLFISPHCAIDHPSNYHLALAVGLAYHYKMKTLLYPARCFWTPDLKRYLEKVLAGNLYVSFESVPYERLIYELQSMCHAGMMSMPPIDAPGMAAEPYRQTKREHTAMNRVFDYVDAAVPVIMNPEFKFLYWFIKRYHTIFDFDAFMSDPPEYRDRIRDLHAGGLSKARKILSVRRQIPRLIEFYESL